MGFEAVPRPGELNSHAELLGPHAVQHMITQELSRVERIHALEKSDIGKNIDEEKEKFKENEEALLEHRHGHHLSEEERDRILELARKRGKVTLSEDEASKDFRITINPETGKFDLVSLKTGRHIVSISPEELVHVAEETHHYQGFITDELG